LGIPDSPEREAFPASTGEQTAETASDQDGQDDAVSAIGYRLRPTTTSCCTRSALLPLPTLVLHQRRAWRWWSGSMALPNGAT
ncbi:MAG: hypothetical protein HC893_05045, partial [Chloroflexaceae bacterium]|nr:hypothetical protein [Chloroflexaceae bacterium]